MNRKRRFVVYGLIVLLAGGSIVGFAQDGGVPTSVQDAAGSALDQALTYIDSVATYLGQGMLYILNLITNDRVSGDLEKPIGYLALITLLLLLFGLLDFARRVIWIGIIVGWVLLIVRVVLDALNI